MKTFSFSTGVITIPGTDGTTKSTTLTLTTGGDFICHSLCGSVIQANVLVLNWGGLVEIKQESADDSQWFNKPLAFDAIAGNGRFPFILDPPKRLASKSNLIITFTQRGTTATDVELILHGNKA